jgi:hypothetical protein
VARPAELLVLGGGLDKEEVPVKEDAAVVGHDEVDVEPSEDRN